MKTLKQISLLILISIVTSCASIKQDPYTLSETKETKEITLKLIDLSTQPYINHVKSIDSVKTRLQSLLSYQKSKKNNIVLIEMFKILVKDNGKVYGFFNIWKKNNVLATYFINQSKEEIMFGFDQILELENKKDK